MKNAGVSLEVVNLRKSWGAVEVLSDVNFEVEPGGFLTLLGPSGCGKSTVLRLVSGLDELSGGQILIGGNDVARKPAAERNIGMVFQNYALFPHMTIEQNISYGLKVRKVARADKEKAIARVADLMALGHLLDRKPAQLSGGQQQRVALARVLVSDRPLVLMDEPLSNLDAKLRRQVREDIRAIQKDLGLTVVYVTHDQEEALAVSDEIVVMRNAAIAQIGTPRQLYDAPNDRFVADFIGEANLLSCRIVEVDGDMATIEIEGYRHRLPARGLGVGPAMLAIRPSRLIIGADEGIAATVAKATYVGVRMEYTLTGDFGQVFAVQEDVDDPLEMGVNVRMSFAEKGPVLLPES